MRLTPDNGYVVVTGAGGGLGRALARGFCQRGFAVAGLGRRLDTLAETGADHSLFHPVQVDVHKVQRISYYLLSFECFFSSAAYIFEAG